MTVHTAVIQETKMSDHNDLSALLESKHDFDEALNHATS